MAALYWIGGGANTNWSTTGNWSTTSGGSSSGTVPVSTTDVIFDANSPSGTSICNSGSIGSLTTTNYPLGTIDQSGTNLVVYGINGGANGNFVLGTGTTYNAGTGSRKITFISEANASTITCAGNTLNVIAFGTGASAAYTLGSNLTLLSTFTFPAGSTSAFKTGNYNITCTSLSFGTTGVLTFGSSTITCASLSLTGAVATNTATFIFTGTNGTITTNGNILNHVIIDAGYTGTIEDNLSVVTAGTIVFNGPFTITLDAGDPAEIDLPSPSNVTMNTSQSAVGTFNSDTPGQQVIIDSYSGSGTYNFSWLNLTDISFSGGTFTATNSIDGGDNSGITITPPSQGGGSGQGSMMLMGVGGM